MKSEAASDKRAPTPDAAAEASLSTYVPDSRRYDELLDASGAVRAHWRPLIERLTGSKAHDTARRALELTRRLIVENGVAYNVYTDPQGADRPWALDPLPLMLSQHEWREIEKGVVQRARVLEALLVDLYGPQRLLAEGLVPPELPFGHPNFLWPCHGLAPKGESWLHIYAADLARAQATRLKTATLSNRFCPRRSAIWACAGCVISSVRCASACAASRRTTPIHWS